MIRADFAFLLVFSVLFLTNLHTDVLPWMLSGMDLDTNKVNELVIEAVSVPGADVSAEDNWNYVAELTGV